MLEIRGRVIVAIATGFEYDPYKRLKKTIYPGGAYETFTYDSRSRLVSTLTENCPLSLIEN